MDPDCRAGLGSGDLSPGRRRHGTDPRSHQTQTSWRFHVTARSLRIEGRPSTCPAAEPGLFGKRLGSFSLQMHSGMVLGRSMRVMLAGGGAGRFDPV